MKRVLDVARRAAKVDSTVLLTGESGVGKEMLARLIHEESLRAAGPFVAINCAAVPDNLLESELFGHVRGAFTGATQDRLGLFEAANGGTLFLDEVGDVSVSTQVKLLRAVQEREIRRVGENRNRPVDVRIVAATNRNLADEVAAGRFRQDLYYRLRVVEILVPPLRNRREDILPLARSFLLEGAHRLGRRVSGFTAEAADQLLRYNWPGNVREIHNVVERAIVLTDKDRIGIEDLPEEIRFARPGAFVSEGVRSLNEIEREYILAVLHSNGGNQAKTAQQLQIGTATLYRKLKQYARRA
jgi:transcriptional regulator with PAS, ATPase and Fis domain